MCGSGGRRVFIAGEWYRWWSGQVEERERRGVLISLTPSELAADGDGWGENEKRVPPYKVIGSNTCQSSAHSIRCPGSERLCFGSRNISECRRHTIPFSGQWYRSPIPISLRDLSTAMLCFAGNNTVPRTASLIFTLRSQPNNRVMWSSDA